jgi:hypothetical protein
MRMLPAILWNDNSGQYPVTAADVRLMFRRMEFIAGMEQNKNQRVDIIAYNHKKPVETGFFSYM